MKWAASFISRFILAFFVQFIVKVNSFFLQILKHLHKEITGRLGIFISPVMIFQFDIEFFRQRVQAVIF